MNDLPTYSSSIGKLKVHVGIKAKYCHKIFSDENVRNRCADIFSEVFREKDICVDSLGFNDDHCHMVFDLGSRYALWQVMKALKGRSSRVLMQEFPFLRKKYFWGGHLWNPSYYLDGVGKDENKMNNYVNNQKYGKPKQENNKQTRLTQFMPPTSVGGN
ncbi:MAG: IS200/IS605 family transposase [Candidatus Diapherotrites archaeon]